MSACAIQSNFPLSTIAPPTAAPCPSIYLVVECVTISAPHSIGLQLTGVGNVLSTISGTPCACAAFANFSISNTVSAGLAIVSPNTALVLSLNAALSSSSVQSGSTNVASIPIFFKVTSIRLNVPPYIEDDATIWLPASQILNKAKKLAACPDEVSIAALPPSRAAILAAT